MAEALITRRGGSGGRKTFYSESYAIAANRHRFYVGSSKNLYCVELPVADIGFDPALVCLQADGTNSPYISYLNFEVRIGTLNTIGYNLEIDHASYPAVASGIIYVPIGEWNDASNVKIWAIE